MRVPPSLESIPRRYRALLFVHPPRWRQEHGAVVLGTLMSVHADRGRSRPTLAERIDFVLAGLRIRAIGPSPAGPRHFASAESIAAITWFDQTNGTIAAGRPVSALEQTRANLDSDRDTDAARIGAISWSALNTTAR